MTTLVIFYVYIIGSKFQSLYKDRQTVLNYLKIIKLQVISHSGAQFLVSMSQPQHKSGGPH